jgi:hypothetical protein
MGCLHLLFPWTGIFHGIPSTPDSCLVLMIKLRSLKYLILSDGGQSVDVGVGTVRRKSKRVQFLSAISIVQLVFMWLLTGNA